ncbi:hypothetical protein [Streptomyces indiaensis]|uniref:Uncharacterized protein n=1 Tax=Streptomyces indiaensis TaxID=284033 RepID=A0ABP5Q348_9ACTN|nr:hypothetical protein [Streptomyces indiaensis]MCF1648670.1 hypothetical protein [Streptomyces indiaensis]
MDEYGWAASPGMPAAEAVRASWAATVAALPVRSHITGAVIGRQPFGIFIRIEGAPDAIALAEITRMPLGMHLPALRASVSGEVYWHDDRHHQVRVRLDEWPGADA